MNIEFSKAKMNYKLNLETQKEFNNYVEDYYEDNDIDLLNEGYAIDHYKTDFWIYSIEEILNNIYTSILYSGVVDTKAIENIVTNYQLDDENITVQIEKSAYANNELDIVLFNEKNQRWYWWNVELEIPLECDSCKPISQGTYKVNAILYFEID